MLDWCEKLACELSAGRTVVMVTAVEVLGSAPCAPGARLLVSDGRVFGTIGGGNLEFTAIDQARKLTVSDRRSLLQSLPLGPVLSQCCGGRVSLHYEHFEPWQAQQFFDAGSLGGRFCTNVDPESYERRHVPGGVHSSFDAIADLSLVDRWWVEPVSLPRQQVAIFGGGHIGKALAQVLSLAPCDLVVIDPREEVLEDLQTISRVVPAATAQGMDLWWRPKSVAVVLTHSHELDYLWVREILLRGDAAWCGLIGSKTKRTRFLRRLRSDGVSEAKIERLTCPIGLSGFASKDPGVIAIATAAQLLPLLADLSHARAGQSCNCALPGNNLTLENVQ